MSPGWRDALTGVSAVVLAAGILRALSHAGIHVDALAGFLVLFGAYNLGFFGGRR